MSDPELSLTLFNKAVEMKRAGRFEEAVRLQVESIKAYPDDPEIMEAYYSLGKIYYLAGNFRKSRQCYIVYLRLCEIKNPPILHDYRSMQNGDSYAKERLMGSFYNIAHHLGRADLDYNYGTRSDSFNEREIYRKSLMGVQCQSTDRYGAYVNQAVKHGYDIVFKEFNAMMANQGEVQNETFSTMRAILAEGATTASNVKQNATEYNTKRDISSCSYDNKSREIKRTETKKTETKKKTKLSIGDFIILYIFVSISGSAIEMGGIGILLGGIGLIISLILAINMVMRYLDSSSNSPKKENELNSKDEEEDIEENIEEKHPKSRLGGCLTLIVIGLIVILLIFSSFYHNGLLITIPLILITAAFILYIRHLFFRKK